MCVQWDGEYFRTVEALTDRALELAEGRFLVGYTDMYAGIDCTAGLRGTERMCLDLVANPQGIRRLIERAFANTRPSMPISTASSRPANSCRSPG